MLVLKRFSLLPQGVRYKLIVAFSLMAVIPLLVWGWFITFYIFPNLNIITYASMGNISLILVISVTISVLGFYVVKEMIDPLVKIAGEAKIMAEGDVSRIIGSSRKDEIGDISSTLNIMTKKIKDNIEELNLYREKTKLINLEINKKVSALTSLLQIGNLILSSTDILEIFDAISQKLSGIRDGDICFIMLFDEITKKYNLVSSCNLTDSQKQGLVIKNDEAVIQMLVIDRDNCGKAPLVKRLSTDLRIRNLFIAQIIVFNKLYGFVVVGNNKEDFVFADDDRQLLNVFVRQASLAVENDLLMRKAKRFSVIDEVTGLYNESYIYTRLDEEIKRAGLYQRTCGYFLIDIDNFGQYEEENGKEKAMVLLKTVADVIKGAVTDIDKSARLNNDRFSVVLPERNKKQSANIAEEIRRQVENNVGKIMGIKEKLTVSIGVSENPIDGSSVDEVIKQAEKVLKNAKTLGKNRVGV